MHYTTFPRTCFLQFCLFVLLTHISASTAYTNTQSENTLRVEGVQEFRFNPNARQGSGAAVNELLQLLADGSGKLRVFIGYDLHYRFAVSAVHETNRQLKILFTAELLTIVGDTMYGDFSVKDYLLPPFMNITINVLNKQKAIVKQTSFKNISWPLVHSDYQDHFIIVNENLLKEGFSLDVRTVEFHYGDEYQQTINKLRRALNQYYKIPESLSAINETLNELEEADFDRVILDEFRLCEAEEIFSTIDYDSVSSRLDLALYDPLMVREHYQALQTRLLQLRDHYNYTISHIDSLIYDHAMSLLLKGDTIRAREMMERTLMYNPAHIPSHLVLADIDYKAGNITASLRRIENLLSRAPAPGKWRKDLDVFTSDIFESEINRAEELITDGRFLEALRMLETLESFCNTILYWQCTEMLIKRMGEAHLGMFRSYLSVARRALASNSFSFAVEYVESALEYRLQSQPYVPDDSEAFDLLTLIVDAMYLQARQLWLMNDFRRSEGLLASAKKVCEKHTKVFCNEEAWLFAEQVQEDKKAAEKITVEVIVSEPAIKTPDMSPAEARRLVADLLSRGHLRAWAGEIEEARNMLNEIIPYALQFNLRQDTIINARIISLSEMIVAKECEFTERDINTQISRVKEHFQNAYYADALRSYQMALQLNKNIQECGWDYDQTLNDLQFVELAAQYHEKLQVAQVAYFRSGGTGFESFILLYDKAVDFYHANILSEWDVRYQSLYDFTATSGNTSLMRAVIPVLSDREETDKAFQLLLLLQEQGFDARELRNLMENAARIAASVVHKNDPDIEPRQFVREKTGQDNWFRAYERSFIRSWPSN